MGYCSYDDRLWYVHIYSIGLTNSHDQMMLFFFVFFVNVRWRVFDIRDPYIAYKINVTVQQMDYNVATKSKEGTKTVWKTVGYATIGPQMHIDNTNRKKTGVTSGPQVQNVYFDL